MKNNKILIAIIVVVLIIICIILALMYYMHDGTIFKEGDPPISDDEIKIEEKVETVSLRNNYFAVKSCIEKYYFYYESIYDFGNDAYLEEEPISSAEMREMQQQNAENLYNLLDNEYIDEKDITKENILTKLKEMQPSIINITDMYVAERSVTMSIYIVDGTIRQKQNGKMENFRMIVKLDLANKTFTVIPTDMASKKYGKIKAGETIEIDCEETIEKNVNNEFNFETIGDEEYIKNLLTQFQEEAMHNRELLYNNLDKRYREEKFKTEAEFEEFMKNNLKKYITLKAKNYQKTETDDYTQYAITDEAGKNYIFRETKPMKYTLLLDTYTIPIPEFNEKYEKSTAQEKVILNINKFMLSLNDGDYRYAYNVLADSFKQNNFSTLEEFENYAKTNFYEENVFDYKKFSDEAETYYTYEIDISDGNNTNSEVKTKTFIVLLGDKTNFELSFNM